jgi:hypothetical protein
MAVASTCSLSRQIDHLVEVKVYSASYQRRLLVRSNARTDFQYVSNNFGFERAEKRITGESARLVANR